MSSLTAAQRWILATAGILTHVNEGDHAHFGGGVRPAGSEAAAASLRAWDVATKADAMDRLEWLLREGHRVDFAKDRDAPPETALAWDLGRLSSLAGWAYQAYHLDAATAWQWATRAAMLSQRAFRGWREFGDSYALGRRWWVERQQRLAVAEGGDAADFEQELDEAARVVEVLLAPGGLWSSLAWDTPLAGAPVPLPAQRVLRVGRGGHETIGAALEAAAEGDRIVVAAGRYAESLVFDQSVELAAEPGGAVVVEARDTQAVYVDDAGVSLEGLVLRASGKDEGGEDVDVVWSESGFLRMVACDVQGGRHGIDLLTAVSEVVLERCVIHDCPGANVVVEGGFLTASQSELRGSGAVAAQIAGECEARLLDCRLHGSKAAGLVVAGEAIVIVRGGEIRDNAGTNVQVQESKDLSLVDCKVLGGHAGLFVTDDGAARLEGCEIRAPRAIGVDVGNGEVILHDCTIADAIEGGNVFVHDGSRAKLRGCRIEGGAFAAVEVHGENSFAELTRCIVKGPKGEGSLVHGKARADWIECSIGGAGKVGFRVDEESAARMAGGTIEDAAEYGVLATHGGLARIEKSAVTGNAMVGIAASDGGKLELIDARVERNAGGGVLADDGTTVRMQGGEVSGPDDGVYFTRSGAHLARVRVHGCGLHGVVAVGAKVRLEDCEIVENMSHGLLVAEEAEVDAARCRIARNGEDDVVASEKGHARLEECEVGGIREGSGGSVERGAGAQDLERPDTKTLGWSEARLELVPLLRTPRVLAAAPQDAGAQYPVHRAFASFLLECVGIDSDRGLAFAHPSHLAAWGVEAADAFAAATENARTHFVDDVAPYDAQAPYPIWGVARDDGCESSRLLLPGWLASFRGRVNGRPVAMVPHRSLLVVGGDGDPRCLRRLIDAAKAEFEASPRKISPALYTVDSADRVVPLVMPAGHPLAADVALGHATIAMAEYGAQHGPLQQHLGESTFVAKLNAARGPEGTPLTLTTWTRSVPSLLPWADRVALVLSPEQKDGEVLTVPWRALFQIAGHLLTQETDLNPPRWRTQGWPDGEALNRLRQARV